MKNLDIDLMDYPIGMKRPDIIKTYSGKSLKEITISAILKNDINNQDIRISPQTLILQAEIAKAAGRILLSENFKRAAELCSLPDEKILEFYRALRPFRSTRAELEAIAETLEHTYNAPLCADLFREAAVIYQKKGVFKKPGGWWRRCLKGKKITSLPE